MTSFFTKVVRWFGRKQESVGGNGTPRSMPDARNENPPSPTPDPPGTAFPILWPGRSTSSQSCDSPRLARFVVMTERPTITWKEELDNILDCVPTPEQLAPWVLRLPEFICHICQGQAIRGVYAICYQCKDRGTPPDTELTFVPKQYAVPGMPDEGLIPNLRPEQYRAKYAEHLAQAVLGITPDASRITSTRSCAYEVTAVWASAPLAPTECPFAQALTSEKERLIRTKHEHQLGQLSLAFWRSVAPSVCESVARRCRVLKRPVRLGFLGDLPALCLDSLPAEPWTANCSAVCWRHVNILAGLREKLRPYLSDLPHALVPSVWSMSLPVVAKSTQSKWPEPEDGAPAISEEDLVKRAPAFGSGTPFTISGVVGRHYSITDEQIDKSDTASAIALLRQCIFDSVNTGILHHFHVTVGIGRFTADPRPAAQIPEVVKWMRDLNEQFPALWFFLDPDSIGWVYHCLMPDCLVDGGVLMKPDRYLQLCKSSTQAAVDQLRGGCRGSRLERLLQQAVFYRRVSAANGFASIKATLQLQFASFLAQDDVPGQLLGRLDEGIRAFIPNLLEDKMVASYNDGQVHGPALTFPEKEGGLYFAISFFPCGSTAAKEAYDRAGGYAKSLSGMRSTALGKIESLRGGVDLIAHLVVCHEAHRAFSFHLSFQRWNEDRPEFLAPALRPAD